MLSAVQKLKYLFDSLLRVGEKVRCTYCGSQDCKRIDKKYLVTSLYECNQCHMYFRHPVEKVEQNKKFYQNDYLESDKITATLPGKEELEKLKAGSFSEVNKNAGRYQQLFKRIFPDKPVLNIVDYGCSWGYITWQLKQYGHNIEGFEISRPRAAYGRQQLGINIVTDEAEIGGDKDIFFSSHVIEHHPSIPSMLALAKKLLKRNGYFIAVSPNGSASYRQKYPYHFHKAWGKVHPNYLNADFYKSVFGNLPYYIGSSPFNFDRIHPLQAGEQVIDDLSGDELLVIVKLRQHDE